MRTWSAEMCGVIQCQEAWLVPEGQELGGLLKTEVAY